MKLNEITAFLAVAESRSMQTAADRLGLTQPAVSRLVQRLEEQLGVVLFDRTARPLTLTAEGEQALEHARGVAGSISSFTDAFSSNAQPRGPVRIGVSHALDFLMTALPIASIRAAFPQVSLRLSTEWTSRLLRQIEIGGVDAAILVTAEHAVPDLPDARRLLDAEVEVVAPRASPGASTGTSTSTIANTGTGTGTSLEALNAVGWVLQPEGCCYRRHLESKLDLKDERLNLIVETFAVETQLSLVARGVGFSLMPLSLLHGAGVRHEVQTLQAPWYDLRVALWLVRRQGIGRLGAVVDTLERDLLAILTPHHKQAA